VVRPNRESVLADPITKAPDHWETLHTFNPAAIVRDGKVVVLYRTRDDSGATGIGMHASRLAMAVSEGRVSNRGHENDMATQPCRLKMNARPESRDEDQRDDASCDDPDITSVERGRWCC